MQKEDSDIVNKLFKIINQIDDEELKNIRVNIEDIKSIFNEGSKNSDTEIKTEKTPLVAIGS